MTAELNNPCFKKMKLVITRNGKNYDVVGFKQLIDNSYQYILREVNETEFKFEYIPVSDLK